MDNQKHIFGFIFILFGFLFLNGCIRLWGGATYVKNTPGDYSEKTYILDTNQIGNSNQQGSIAS